MVCGRFERGRSEWGWGLMQHRPGLLYCSAPAKIRPVLEQNFSISDPSQMPTQIQPWKGGGEVHVGLGGLWPNLWTTHTPPPANINPRFYIGWTFKRALYGRGLLLGGKINFATKSGCAILPILPNFSTFMQNSSWWPFFGQKSGLFATFNPKWPAALAAPATTGQCAHTSVLAGRDFGVWEYDPQNLRHIYSEKDLCSTLLMCTTHHSWDLTLCGALIAVKSGWDDSDLNVVSRCHLIH